MKPSIPDRGIVVKLDGDQAVVRMLNEGSCRKCGAAAIGLCKAGQMHMVTVRNAKNAAVGDEVKIGLARDVQQQGYLLGFVVPPAALLAGIALGHVAATAAGLTRTDLIAAAAGLIVMVALSTLSFRRLKRLSSGAFIEIVHVL